MGRKLSEEVSNILWNKGTEPAFSGKYNHHYEEGFYLCVNCQLQLFHSVDKFDSGSGWPSFSNAVADLIYLEDHSIEPVRIEVKCPSCEAHLGHVFDDGPLPTGQRYCINSLALDFEEEFDE